MRYGKRIEELSRTCSIGKLIKFFKFRDKLLSLMAGRALRGMHRTADYKGGKALKSCHTEFVHIYSAAFFIIEGKIPQGVFPFLLPSGIISVYLPLNNLLSAGKHKTCTFLEIKTKNIFLMTSLPKLTKQVMTGAAFCCTLWLAGCAQQQPAPVVNLIPKPVNLTLGEGYFRTDSASICDGAENIRYVINPDMAGEEAYRLTVSKNGIEAQAATETGLFYARQTLLQLLQSGGVPCVTIEDSPRFGYRGLHLDVSRHFFPKEEVMKLIDVMAYYKLNRLHFHLTDAGGWRIQIDKYPKLTQEAAFRTESDWRKWWDGGDRKYLPEGTEGAYGGYYTKADIREIVAHAAEKHITVIPEIEFPGHSDEVFRAYPELCCAGKPYSGGDFCIGNEKSYQFMEDVLTEIMELFPSEYIHIGGDEASKAAWKTCPKCQALMRREGMKSVDELQSYMIHHADQFITSKGRKLIGWDEILQGGLAPNAAVMSWRGEEAGFRSVRMGHNVVMTPGNYMYLDFYQAFPNTQPYAIGGYTPIKKVYSYNPIPKDSLTAEEEKHFMGVQGNTWTEYIPTPEHLEYMMFPRALAVAEIGWTPQDLRSWEDFKPRVNAHIPVLHRKGINAFTLSNEIDITMSVDTLKKQISVFMDAEKHPAEIHYTTDGSEPTMDSPIYKEAVIVTDSADIRAAIFKDGQMQGEPTAKRIDYHRGINKPIHYYNRLYPGYMAGGMNALLDGYRGSLTYLDGRWQGYLDNLDCVIDMGEITDLHKVSSRWMQLTGPGVYQPAEVELLTSEDGKTFTSRGTVPTTISQDDSRLLFQEYTFWGEWKARYVKVKAKNPKGFIFVDEIVIW